MVELQTLAPKRADGVVQTHISYIYHISDLHIGHDRARRRERNMVFGRFIGKLRSSPCIHESMVVITGDIFHFKTRLSAEDVADFGKFIKTIGLLCPTLIIPGNHDASLNDTRRLGLLSIVNYVRNGNVFLFNKSGLLRYCNIIFHHISIFEPVSEALILANVEAARAHEHADSATLVGLYHGSADGATFGSMTVTDSNITEVVTSAHDLFMLGS